MIGHEDSRRAPRNVDDAGGVWIKVGVLGGVVLYAGMVVMAAAGFSAVLPLVVVPPVLVALIGANSMLGGRGYGRSSGRPVGDGRSSGPPADEGQRADDPCRGRDEEHIDPG